MWDKIAAIKHLNLNAQSRSLGRCAEFIRKSVEAGGVVLQRCASAKDYDRSLLAAGFVPVPVHTPQEQFMVGDIVIVEPIPGHPHGHMAMFDGSAWISDFRQRHGHYPGPRYRQLRPAYTVYRYDPDAARTANRR